MKFYFVLNKSPLVLTPLPQVRGIFISLLVKISSSR